MRNVYVRHTHGARGIYKFVFWITEKNNNNRDFRFEINEKKISNPNTTITQQHTTNTNLKFIYDDHRAHHARHVLDDHHVVK